MGSESTAAAGIQMVQFHDEFQSRCHCKRRRTDASKVLAATTNDDDWKQEDGEQGAGRSVWGGTH